MRPYQSDEQVLSWSIGVSAIVDLRFEILD